MYKNALELELIPPYYQWLHKWNIYCIVLARLCLCMWIIFSLWIVCETHHFVQLPCSAFSRILGRYSSEGDVSLSGLECYGCDDFLILLAGSTISIALHINYNTPESRAITNASAELNFKFLLFLLWGTLKFYGSC